MIIDLGQDSIKASFNCVLGVILLGGLTFPLTCGKYLNYDYSQGRV